MSIILAGGLGFLGLNAGILALYAYVDGEKERLLPLVCMQYFFGISMCVVWAFR